MSCGLFRCNILRYVMVCHCVFWYVMVWCIMSCHFVSLRFHVMSCYIWCLSVQKMLYQWVKLFGHTQPFTSTRSLSSCQIVLPHFLRIRNWWCDASWVVKAWVLESRHSIHSACVILLWCHVLKVAAQIGGNEMYCVFSALSALYMGRLSLHPSTIRLGRSSSNHIFTFWDFFFLLRPLGLMGRRAMGCRRMPMGHQPRALRLRPTRIRPGTNKTMGWGREFSVLCSNSTLYSIYRG